MILIQFSFLFVVKKNVTKISKITSVLFETATESLPLFA